MKNLNTKFLAGIIVAVLLLGGGTYVAMSDRTRPAAPDESSIESSIAPAAGEQGTAEVRVNAQPVTTETGPAIYGIYNVPADPLGDRSIGDPKAPIKIEEFASLSCSHCAAFHGTVLPELKAKYIDTGKVVLTFTDFPLNAPALDGAMISRCMSPDRYFPFLAMLFENQDQWAFSQDYQKSLRQNAKLAGMSDEKFDKCLADTKLKEGLVARMQSSQTQHGINSTPSFVINGTTVLTGALPLEAFDQAIADALKGNAAKDIDDLKKKLLNKE